MKLFSKKASKPSKSKERNQRMITPERDWKVIFVIFILFNLGMLVFHGFLFFRLSKGGFFEVPEPSPDSAEAVNQDLLENTLRYFAEKESALVESVASPELAPSVK